MRGSINKEQTCKFLSKYKTQVLEVAEYIYHVIYFIHKFIVYERYIFENKIISHIIFLLPPSTEHFFIFILNGNILSYIMHKIHRYYWLFILILVISFLINKLGRVFQFKTPPKPPYLLSLCLIFKEKTQQNKTNTKSTKIKRKASFQNIRNFHNYHWIFGRMITLLNGHLA